MVLAEQFKKTCLTLINVVDSLAAFTRSAFTRSAFTRSAFTRSAFTRSAFTRLAFTGTFTEGYAEIINPLSFQLWNLLFDHK